MIQTPTVTEIPPLEHTIDRKNLRAVFTVDQSLGTDVDFDVESLKASFDRWLNDRHAMFLTGVTMKLYEVKDETWRERESML